MLKFGSEATGHVINSTLELYISAVMKNEQVIGMQKVSCFYHYHNRGGIIYYFK